MEKVNGYCPICNSSNISVGVLETDEDGKFFSRCECKKCHTEFEEHYHLEFDGCKRISGNKTAKAYAKMREALKEFVEAEIAEHSYPCFEEDEEFEKKVSEKVFQRLIKRIDNVDVITNHIIDANA